MSEQVPSKELFNLPRVLEFEDGTTVSVRFQGQQMDIAGTAGSHFQFFPSEARRLRDWLNLALKPTPEPPAEQRPPMIDGIDSSMALRMADIADRAGYLTQSDKALIVLARAHRELRERFAKACGEVTRLSQPPPVSLKDVHAKWRQSHAGWCLSGPPEFGECNCSGSTKEPDHG